MSGSETKVENVGQQAEEGDVVHTDIVSQLQDKLNQMSYFFFGILSGVFSDAPPLAISNEELDIPDAPTTLKEEIQELPSKLAKVSQEFDELVEQLPNMDQSEDEQIQTILQLQERNEQLGEQLTKELASAKMVLQRQQELMLELAENELKQRTYRKEKENIQE
eukprot:TRINITY_DN9472_c0_g1_i2.p1 TRINITY_DN9472_c0_g1~~TRINITY_DN9472_c0_g1_i2.p1  ORF type:complete len:164 (-),score=30.24 TRINITY_DN9472_c0_g1_i2:248-739(-)